MNEFIPLTPESESEDRQNWDRIIRCLHTLSELNDEIDLFEELEALRDETDEDALMVIFSHWLAATVPENHSSDLSGVMSLLEESGLIESQEEE